MGMPRVYAVPTQLVLVCESASFVPLPVVSCLKSADTGTATEASVLHIKSLHQVESLPWGEVPATDVRRAPGCSDHDMAPRETGAG